MNNPTTILVIDDDNKFSFGLVAVLKRAGFQVVSATSGAEGLEKIQAINPDLIICDIMMPPPNGIQLKKELALDPHTARIPFLFLTARSATVDKLAGLKNGADDYITKPFEVDILLARIQSVLRRDDLGHQRGLQEALAALDQLRSSIAAHLTGKLRINPTVLLASVELVVRGKFVQSNTELDYYVKSVSGSPRRINLLIEDLEMLYEIGQGRLNTIHQTVDLDRDFRTPITQTVQTWENKHLHLQFNINPDVSIYAPVDEFCQVVAHLVDNACKFSPGYGNIAINLAANGIGGCILEVIDEGSGIPSNMREKVFEQYYQIKPADSRPYSGLGIGLTLARAYAQALNGNVQIIDNPEGCRVRMVLPPYDVDGLSKTLDNLGFTLDKGVQDA